VLPLGISLALDWVDAAYAFGSPHRSAYRRITVLSQANSRHTLHALGAGAPSCPELSAMPASLPGSYAAAIDSSALDRLGNAVRVPGNVPNSAILASRNCTDLH
jgi:hypothetical protein